MPNTFAQTISRRSTFPLQSGGGPYISGSTTLPRQDYRTTQVEQQICQAAIEGDIDCINDESRQYAARVVIFE
jgi:hypothetical protein